MGFRERLREEIEYKGLLVKEISNAVGISNSTFLSYIDARGVLPNVETAVKIAHVLGVSVESLVNGNAEEARAEQNQSDEEKALIENYHQLSAHDKYVLLELSNVLKKTAS